MPARSMSTIVNPELARATQIPLPPSPPPSVHEPANPDFVDLAEPESQRINSISSLYLKYAQEDDTAVLSQWNADLDVQLLFAGLFSAIVTAFVIQSLSNLQEDFGQTSAKLLQILVAQSLGQTTEISPPPPFKVDSTSVVVNALWFTSLITSLGAALFGILCKQWLREYVTLLSPIPSIRALQRYNRNMAMENWRVSDMVAILPVALHLAVMLFLAGLVVYLRPINDTVAIVVASAVGFVGAAYAVLFFLPFFTKAPFSTPVTRMVMWGFIRFVLSLMFIMYIRSRNMVVVVSRFVSLKPIRITELLQRTSIAWKILSRWITSSKRIYLTEHLSNDHQKEGINTVLLAWLMRCPLSDHDLDVVIKLLSEMKQPKALRMLERMA